MRVISSYYSSIYGLGISLNKKIPGIADTESSYEAVDVEVHFGFMPSWFQSTPVERELWYTSPNPEGCDHRLVIWKVDGGDYYHVRYADGTEFLIDRLGSRIWATWPAQTLTLEDTATYLLGPIMGLVLLLRGGISLHASAIVIAGQAIAIVGPAGSGKSTTAAAFADLGYSILAEDVVTLEDLGHAFLVQPAYPCIRLWPSAVRALYGHQAELPRLTPTWDKCYLDLTQEQFGFQNEALQLAAIYLLDDRREDPTSPSVEDMSEGEGLISLVANTYATYLMDKEMRAREFEILGRVLKNVPLRKLIPHTDPTYIRALCHTIIGDFECLVSDERVLQASEQALHV